MVHFVPNPEPSDYSVERPLPELKVTASNGRVRLNCYAGAIRPDILVRNGNPRFDAEPSRDGPNKINLFRYVLSGLVAGDEIAAFDGKTKLTPWTKITAVTADHVAAQRTAKALPTSKYKPNVRFDGYGADVYLPGGIQPWIDKTDQMIKRILSNSIGRLVLDRVSDIVTICYDVEKKGTSYSSVSGSTGELTIGIRPADYVSNPAPGRNYDEILLHEFAHFVDGGCKDYDNAGGINFDNTDFFTITITNVYAAINRRPLRAGHLGYERIPDLYQGPTGEAKFASAHKSNFNKAKSAIGSVLYNKIVFAESPWNPFP